MVWLFYGMLTVFNHDFSVKSIPKIVSNYLSNDAHKEVKFKISHLFTPIGKDFEVMTI